MLTANGRVLVFELGYFCLEVITSVVGLAWLKFTILLDPRGIVNALNEKG